MDNGKQAELEQKYGAVIDLALAASDAYSALAKAKRENKPVAELGALSEANDAAADKLRAAIAGWTPDQAKECSSYMQRVGFVDAMRGEEGKRQWDQEVSLRYSRGLVALKHGFILKSEEDSRDDDRVKIVNSRIRTTVKFIPAAAAVHYKPEHGLNDRAVRDVLARLDKEVKFRSGSDARAVRMGADSFRKLYRELKDASPRDWLEERTSGPKPVTLAQTLPAGAADQLKAGIANATPAVTPTPAVPPTVPASQTGTGSKKEGGRKQRR